MPQFPYHLDLDPQPTSSPTDEVPELIFEAAPKADKKPVKFKSVEPKGPVTRVKLNNRTRTKSSASKKGPFKDSGIFEDTQSLVDLRDQYGKPFALTVVVIALVALTYWFSNPSDNSAALAQKIDPLMAIADKHENDMTAAATTNEQLYSESIDVADKLLAFNDDAEALERGAELKLKTLATWDAMNLKTGHADDSVSTNLESTSREFINSRSSDVANSAKVGLTMIRIRNYLLSPKSEIFPEILDQFKLVSRFASDDNISAKNLLTIAEGVQKKGLKSEANQLFRAINLTCSASYNSEIASIGNKARRYLNNSNNLLEVLKTDLLSGNPESVKSIRKTINENLRPDTVTTANVESILDFIELAAEKNQVRPIKVLLKDIAKSIHLIPAGLERDSIKQKYASINNRIELVGNLFNYQGLYSLQGKALSRTSFKKTNKLMLFWSPQNPTSIEKVEEYSKQRSKFLANQVQIIPVATVANDNDLNKITELAGKYPRIEFLTLPGNNRDSQAFSTRLDLPTLPYWIMIDNKDVVKALNVSLDFNR